MTWKRRGAAGEVGCVRPKAGLEDGTHATTAPTITTRLALGDVPVRHQAQARGGGRVAQGSAAPRLSQQGGKGAVGWWCRRG